MLAKGMQALEHVLFPHHIFSAHASEVRDFLATGAACGICTVLRAPLEGVMFVVEEAASFFTTLHVERTFLACLCAYWTTFAVHQPDEGFTKFAQTRGPFCNLQTFFDVASFVALAAIGGVLGSAFNHAVIRLNRWRKHTLLP